MAPPRSTAVEGSEGEDGAGVDAVRSVDDLASTGITTTPCASISSTMDAFAGSPQKSTNDCANTGPTPSMCVNAACAKLSGPPFTAADAAFRKASRVP